MTDEIDQRLTLPTFASDSVGDLRYLLLNHQRFSGGFAIPPTRSYGERPSALARQGLSISPCQTEEINERHDSHNAVLPQNASAQSRPGGTTAPSLITGLCKPSPREIGLQARIELLTVSWIAAR